MLLLFDFVDLALLTLTFELSDRSALLSSLGSELSSVLELREVIASHSTGRGNSSGHKKQYSSSSNMNLFNFMIEDKFMLEVLYLYSLASLF